VIRRVGDFFSAKKQITLESAAVRGGKDIAVKGDLLQEVDRYNGVIERLKAFVARSLPGAGCRRIFIAATACPSGSTGSSAAFSM
jgi:hypothetical protein